MTYAIGVGYESDYLLRLLKQVGRIVDPEDFIIIQVDQSNTNEETLELVEDFA